MASQTSRATGNIIDYVRTRTGSFDERPFNDVDALVLASLAYQTMPDVVPTLVDWERRYGTASARWRTLMAGPFSPTPRWPTPPRPCTRRISTISPVIRVWQTRN